MDKEHPTFRAQIDLPVFPQWPLMSLAPAVAEPISPEAQAFTRIDPINQIALTLGSQIEANLYQIVNALGIGGEVSVQITRESITALLQIPTDGERLAVAEEARTQKQFEELVMLLFRLAYRNIFGANLNTSISPPKRGYLM